MGKLVLAIDQGTTATTVLILDADLNVLAKSSTEILPTYPQYGWVEHDLNKIWSGTQTSIKKALLESNCNPKDIAAIGITNQRETVGIWDRKTGEPLHAAIVWQCRRTSKRCDELRSQGLSEKIKLLTGLVIDPYFSATKMEWLLNNVPDLQKRAASGDALFGTIDSFLLHKLTGGRTHATDVTNASRTMLMDLRSLSWDPFLLKTFSIPAATLPKIQPSSGVFGTTYNMGILPDGIPIAGILGDQQAALFGQLGTEPGDTKCTYGTGSFLVCNTGSEIRYSQHGLLSTVAWQMNGKVAYALEGSAFVAGAAVQFLRDNLGIISSSSEVEPLALQAQPEEMGDLVFVPSLTGLGAPYWESGATGMLYGLTRGTQKSHIARATLEGIALQNDDIFNAIREDIQPSELLSIKVDGGASANNFLMQLQCDLAGIPLERPKILETTAVGSGMAAGLAAGIWKDINSLKNSWHVDKTFRPQRSKENIAALKLKWKKAIRRILVN